MQYFNEANDVSLVKLLKKIEMDKKADAIRCITGGLSPIIIMLIAVAVGMSGYVAYGKLKKPNYEKYMVDQAVVNVPIFKAPDKNHIREKAKEEELTRLKEIILPRPDTKAFIHEVAELVDNHPITLVGWNADELIFSIDKETNDISHLTNWERDGKVGGSIYELRDALNIAVRFEMTGDLGKTVKIIESKKLPYEGDPEQTLTEAKNNSIDLIDILQNSYIQNWIMTKETNYMRFNEIIGLPSPENMEPRIRYNTFTFEVRGEETWVLRELADKLKDFKTLKVKAIKVTNRTTPEWIITGELYEL
jgi:hypothetical protein